jgi:hypothetical protein
MHLLSCFWAANSKIVVYLKILRFIGALNIGGMAAGANQRIKLFLGIWVWWW